MGGAHLIAVLTDWDEFTINDWQRIYDNMQKPAFVFDRRIVLDKDVLEKIGFSLVVIGS